MQTTTPRRRRLRIAAGAFGVWWLAGIGSALVATRAHCRAIPARTELSGRAIENATARTADGVTVRGWLVHDALRSDRCVVLVAGIGGNRLAMQRRAAWYLAHGWSTLLVDLRGTGASDATRISFGWFEARDLPAWRAWLRARGFATIAAHGLSLGAAAIAYGDGDWAFAVLEACYADIAEALAARLWWIPLPALALWPLRQSAAWLLGVECTALRPVDTIARLHCPTLILCGDADTKVGPDASHRLLAACPAAEKRFVAIRGAGHVDLFAHDSPTWETAVAAFAQPRGR